LHGGVGSRQEERVGRQGCTPKRELLGWIAGANKRRTLVLFLVLQAEGRVGSGVIVHLVRRTLMDRERRPGLAAASFYTAYTAYCEELDVSGEEARASSGKEFW